MWRQMLGLLSSIAARVGAWCGRNPQRRALLLVIVFSPAALTAYLISEHAVNVPVWDGWERGVLIEKAHTG